jgi:plastocyanin
MKLHRKVAVRLLVVIGALLLISANAHATTHLVEMSGLSFLPANLTVTEGDTVLWRNISSITHTTTSGTPGLPDGLWDSGFMGLNAEFPRAFNTAGTYLYYCKPHGGFGMVGQITVESNATGIGDTPPPAYGLGQNYPNPFNPVTTIAYTIEQPAFVEVEIFDTRGRRVRVLENTIRQAGPHAVFFDGKSRFGEPIPSGIYFYQLKLDGVAVDMRKMVLIK